MLVESQGGARVTRAWEGKTVVCVAPGPSLTSENLEIVRKSRERDLTRVIVVNDVYLVAPWADVLYFADARWAQWHEVGLKKTWPWVTFSADEVRAAFKGFAGQKVTIEHPGKYEGAVALKNHGPDGLSEKPDGINTGSNSGYQALNIAVLAGGNPILLVGYDFRFFGSRSHAHNGHQIKHPESCYLGFARRFTSTKKQLERLQVRVLNCTPGSAIEAFPQADLGECLARTA